MKNVVDYRDQRKASRHLASGPGPEPVRYRLPAQSSFLSRNYGFLALMLLAGAGGWFLVDPGIAERSLVAAARLPIVIAPPPTSRGEIVSRHFPVCGSGRRSNCVVDGDTFWLAGEKIRIADINTPEVSEPRCAAEAKLGARATRRLQSLLNAGPFEVRKGFDDEDRYGRKLRTLHRGGKSLGDALAAEGLANEWNGNKQDWCG